MIKYCDDFILKTKTCGELIVEKFVSKDEIHVTFLKTGTKLIVTTNQMHSGSIKDLKLPKIYGKGFIGMGEYSSKLNKLAYQTWFDMLRRCYCPKRLKQRPTYQDCTVCEEWHNFQNFAVWYYAQLPSTTEKWQLDKDIKVSGNKLYSPETCLMVTGEANNIKAHEKSYRLNHEDLGVVEVTNLREFCLSNNLSESVMYMLVNNKWQKHRGYTFISKL